MPVQIQECAKYAPSQWHISLLRFHEHGSTCSFLPEPYGVVLCKMLRLDAMIHASCALQNDILVPAIWWLRQSNTAVISEGALVLWSNVSRIRLGSFSRRTIHYHRNFEDWHFQGNLSNWTSRSFSRWLQGCQFGIASQCWGIAVLRRWLASQMLASNSSP